MDKHGWTVYKRVYGHFRKTLRLLAGKIPGPHGGYYFRSTKETDERKARKIGAAWEDAARLARKGELTQTASIKVLGDMMKITTEEELVVENVEGFLKETLNKVC